SASRTKAKSDGLTVKTPGEAAAWADVIMILAPDTRQQKLYKDSVEPNLTPGKTLMFAHGFNIRFGTIQPPKDVDVSMIAPKAPGHRMREVFTEGGGTPSLLAIHQDATGNAKTLALSYAKAIGATRAGVIALVKAGFETLVEAGYQPEIAYFECVHELKLIVDLIYQGGLNYMRYSVSDTAEHGDYTGGPRIVTDETRKAMRQILKDIQDGTYARRWIAENEAGRPWFTKQRIQEQNQLVEQVGERLRAMMPFLKPVSVHTAAPAPKDTTA